MKAAARGRAWPLRAWRKCSQALAGKKARVGLRRGQGALEVDLLPCPLGVLSTGQFEVAVHVVSLRKDFRASLHAALQEVPGQGES